MMLVGFEPTPEDWCLKPAPLVTLLTGYRPLGHNIRRRTPPRETDTGVEPVAFRFQVRPDCGATTTPTGLEPATPRFEV